MGNSESKKIKKVEPASSTGSSTSSSSRQTPLSNTVKRIYGLDQESRIASANTYTNLANKTSLIVKRYLKKSGSQLDEKEITKCVNKLARSILERVTHSLYNKNILTCIVLACFILVISRYEQIDDAVIIESMGESCGVDRVREILSDIKNRKFSEKGCYIVE